MCATRETRTRPCRRETRGDSARRRTRARRERRVPREPFAFGTKRWRRLRSAIYALPPPPTFALVRNATPRTRVDASLARALFLRWCRASRSRARNDGGTSPVARASRASPPRRLRLGSPRARRAPPPPATRRAPRARRPRRAPRCRAPRPWRRSSRARAHRASTRPERLCAARPARADASRATRGRWSAWSPRVSARLGARVSPPRSPRPGARASTPSRRRRRSAGHPRRPRRRPRLRRRANARTTRAPRPRETTHRPSRRRRPSTPRTCPADRARRPRNERAGSSGRRRTEPNAARLPRASRRARNALRPSPRGPRLPVPTPLRGPIYGMKRDSSRREKETLRASRVRPSQGSTEKKGFSKGFPEPLGNFRTAFLSRDSSAVAIKKNRRFPKTNGRRSGRKNDLSRAFEIARCRPKSTRSRTGF